jgi:hypothetical protein
MPSTARERRCIAISDQFRTNTPSGHKIDYPVVTAHAEFNLNSRAALRALSSNRSRVAPLPPIRAADIDTARRRSSPITLHPLRSGPTRRIPQVLPATTPNPLRRRHRTIHRRQIQQPLRHRHHHADASDTNRRTTGEPYSTTTGRVARSAQLKMW